MKKGYLHKKNKGSGILFEHIIETFTYRRLGNIKSNNKKRAEF